MLQSTHLVDFGAGKSSELAIVCGNYFRVQRSYIFSGNVSITGWMRMPANVILIPCVLEMVETKSEGMLNTSDNRY